MDYVWIFRHGTDRTAYSSFVAAEQEILELMKNYNKDKWKISRDTINDGERVSYWYGIVGRRTGNWVVDITKMRVN